MSYGSLLRTAKYHSPLSLKDVHSTMSVLIVDRRNEEVNLHNPPPCVNERASRKGDGWEPV